jgi:hypothetical protein
LLRNQLFTPLSSIERWLLGGSGAWRELSAKGVKVASPTLGERASFAGRLGGEPPTESVAVEADVTEEMDWCRGMLMERLERNP